ncbi:multiubiquitin domain-containing protein [Chitinimonas naiadis]
MYTDDEVVDLETHAKAKKPVPPGKKYQIKVDKQQYVVDRPEMTGRQILELAGKIPAEQYILQMKEGSSVRKIELSEIVSFLKPGIERFMTIPNEVTEGEGPLPRREFSLLEEDELYLDALGLPWDTAIESGLRRVVIHNWPIPVGYNNRFVSVNVQLPAGYPDTQIDMAYFYPPLIRADGQVIGALSPDPFDGKEWQRWSRHRTASSAWRMGIDCLETHMALVTDWLAAELSK